MPNGSGSWRCSRTGSVTGPSPARATRSSRDVARLRRHRGGPGLRSRHQRSARVGAPLHGRRHVSHPGSTVTYQWIADGVSSTVPRGRRSRPRSIRPVLAHGARHGVGGGVRGIVGGLGIDRAGGDRVDAGDHGYAGRRSASDGRPGAWTDGTSLSYRWFADGREVRDRTRPRFEWASPRSASASAPRSPDRRRATRRSPSVRSPPSRRPSPRPASSRGCRSSARRRSRCRGYGHPARRSPPAAAGRGAHPDATARTYWLTTITGALRLGRRDGARGGYPTVERESLNSLRVR